MLKSKLKQNQNWSKLTCLKLEHTVFDGCIDGVGEVAHVRGSCRGTFRAADAPRYDASDVRCAPRGASHWAAAVSLTGALVIFRVHAQHRCVHRDSMRLEHFVARGEIHDAHRRVQQHVGLAAFCANVNTSVCHVFAGCCIQFRAFGITSLS